MSKYLPLEKYLKENSNKTLIPMSFSDIEKVLGFKLPESSKKHRAWWSNNSSNNVMTEAWLNAGFEAKDVDMQSHKLAFRRIKTAKPSPFSSFLKPKPVFSNVSENTNEESSKKHPIFGALKDYFIIPPDLDLTEPLWEEGHSYDDIA